MPLALGLDGSYKGQRCRGGCLPRLCARTQGRLLSGICSFPDPVIFGSCGAGVRERDHCGEGSEGQISRGRHHFPPALWVAGMLVVASPFYPGFSGNSFRFLPLPSSSRGDELGLCQGEKDWCFVPLYCGSQERGKCHVLHEKGERYGDTWGCTSIPNLTPVKIAVAFHSLKAVVKQCCTFLKHAPRNTWKL